MKKSIEEQVRDITLELKQDYEKGRYIDQKEVFNRPNKNAVTDIVSKMLRILFPGHFRDKYYRSFRSNGQLSHIIEDVIANLSEQIELVMRCNAEELLDQPNSRSMAEELACEFFRKVPKIRDLIDGDLEATLQGDPAAFNKDEIILSYPGIFATTIYRMAHELHLLGIPLIPRMMTEYAHNVTGIDIHPGATIGKYFFMDHGTGIVIGSTTIIGDHVKVYQGVTLGALSTSGGQSLRGTKRHPTIEDNVTIYSGASILGGDTVIGESAVIGGNAFITSSVPPNARVTIKHQELELNYRGKENHPEGKGNRH